MAIKQKQSKIGNNAVASMPTIYKKNTMRTFRPN